MKLIATSIGVVCFTAVLSSCTPERAVAPLPIERIEDPRVLLNKAAEEETNEIPAIQRYSIVMEEALAMPEARSVRLRVRTTSNLRSGPTRVTITIPELQSVAALKENRVERAAERVVSLDSGQTEVSEFVIGPPSNDNYFQSL